MRQRGVDPNPYDHAFVFVNNSDPHANEYLRERVGVAGINAIYSERVPAALWRERYFRDSQPEEFAVILKSDGSLHSVWHKLAEEAPGASLDKDQAVARAEEFLRREKNLDLKGWSLVGDESKKRQHRVDHTLTWEQTQPLDSAQALAANSQDHAHARIQLKVLGDEVTNYRVYVHIPERCEHKQQERGLSR